MFLKRFLFVNWGNIPTQAFELGPVNLFSGGNGSGKTTAADAIQTVMTAAHENLFQYNPGQEETTQRGRGGKRVRTLASYVLGCDDGSYARLDPSDGYLAAIFHPTQGESADPFTALICVRAWLDSSGSTQVARQEELTFLILPGEQLELDHLVEGAEATRSVVPLEQIQTRLIRAFGQRGVERYDTKKAYLRRLYGALRGRTDAVTEQEAVAAARAFSRFMAYKPVQGINRFVAEEILERRDLGEAIRSVSSQLKTIHAMERDAGNLVESIEILKQAGQHSQLYIERWIQLNLIDYTLAQHEYLQRQAEYQAAKRKQQEQRQDLARTEGDLEQARLRRQGVHDQLVSLEAQRMGVDALKRKDDLERARDQQASGLGALATALHQQDLQLQANRANSRIIEGLLPQTQLPALEASALCGRVLRQGQPPDLALRSLLQQDLTGDISALERFLDQAREIQSLHNQWAAHWHEAEDGQSLRDRLALLAHEL
jgi:hypothetical protein